jgi:hypothetical protein
MTARAEAAARPPVQLRLLLRGLLLLLLELL